MNDPSHPVAAAAAAEVEETIAPARTIALAGSGAAWLIEAGRVNIFATPVADGAARTARHRVCGIEAPGILLDLPAAVPGIRLDAIVDPGGEIVPVARTALFARDGELRDRAIEGVTQWLESCFAGCGGLQRSRPARETADSGEVIVAAGGILDGAHGLVWRRVGYGAGALFDVVPVGGEAMAVVPLAPGGWLRAFEPLRLVPITTRQLLGRGALDEAVATVQAALAEVVLVALALERVDESLRRGRRAAQIAVDTRRVMGDLARMVGAEAPQRVDQAANREMLSAVHRIAERLGVKARGPTAVRQAEAELEPSLEEILRASGLQSRPIRLADGWAANAIDDLLAFREDGRPVALLCDRRGRYTMLDAANGVEVPLDASAAAGLAEEAHVLYQALPDKPLKLRDLLLFGMQRSWADVLTLAGAALLGGFLASTPAMASRMVLETLIPQHLTALLVQTGLALALFALVSALFVYTGTISMARIRARASTRLKAALWDRVLRQPMPFLARYTAPDLTMRIATAENVVSAFHTTAHQSMTTLAFLVINIATMIWLSPPVAAVAVAILAVLVAVTLVAAWAQKRAFTLGEQAEGSTTTFVHALTNGVRKLRLAGAEERGFVKWADRFTRSRMKLINVRKVTNRYATFLAGFTLLATAGLFLVVARLSTTPLGSGAFFGFITAFGVAVATLASLGRAVLQLAFQLASVPYMQPVLDAVPPLQARKSNPGQLSGKIEIAGVSFGYNDGGLVLSGVSIAAEAGEFVAVVGPTGCGKSTLLKLLLGLESPHAGAVLYDQMDLASLDVDAVRRQIGMVMQRPQLIPTSIFENLRGVTDIGIEEAWDAARLAGIAADIQAMPMGLHTLVTEGSQTISGGQRQRLALARALARKPAILLLDEATSALDNGAQAEVMENLADLGCTRIVIAHRLSTIMKADRIIVLDRGRVVETGTYQSLKADGGLFARLATGQVV